MTINFQFVKIPTSDTMIDSVTKKLNKLGDKYDWIINARVYFKKEKDVSGKDSICEIDLSVPGPKIFASSQEKNFEMAAKNTISDLIKQLKKKKATFKNR